ncbi:MAG: 2-nitropropane dioxygenase, partial [Isosphaeraceae bacterium]
MELLSTDGFHETLERAIGDVAEPFLVVDRGGVAGLIMGPPAAASLEDLERLIAFVPACRLEQLGDPSFRETHGTRFACMAGAMANGIGSVEV